MLRQSVLYSAILLGTVSAASATEYSAELKAHAFIPAKTYISAPNDAQASIQTSGKFTTGLRNDQTESVEGTSNGRETGVFLPFKGQPIQGHSGIKHMDDGTYWILTDNGAGSKANSPDFMLYLNQYDIDFDSNEFKHLKTIFLHDPDKNVPFRIQNEATAERYLTGADFDPESFQFANGYLWVGDEFGPYLIQATMDGKVVKVYETKLDGKVIRSPDHYAQVTPAAPNGTLEFEVKRSKGFEGMASSQDGTKLYALLEGALYDPAIKNYANNNGKEYLQIVEFDVQKEDWTGRTWQYPLEQNGLAIGDFNMIDADYGLIIERDNGEGVIEFACEGKAANNCFDQEKLPKFKRIYKVKMNDGNVGKAVEKVGYIDLLNIKDPNKVSRKALSDGKFVFPFFTIENVDIVDAETIIVGNDNNLPFSSSRKPNEADDNELILLKVADFLKAQ
mgnify:CR=1 FL=1